MKQITFMLLTAATMTLIPMAGVNAQCSNCQNSGTAHAGSAGCTGGRCHYGNCSSCGNPMAETAKAARKLGQGAHAWGSKGMRGAASAALCHPWHCNYYYMDYGSPVALVVPPTAERHYNLGWGVANSRLTRTWHQFGRAFPGEGAGGADGQQMQATPPWPSDTSQFGVYYVRGPW